MNKKEAEELAAYMANASRAATEAANKLSELAGELRTIQLYLARKSK